MKFSLEQKNAINHISGPALILAVPGAGKTTVLVHRTYNLIANHNINPENILSITFSKASSIDMKKRFNTLFPQAASYNVHFSTIHSFCYGLIREYAYINRINYRLIEDNKRQLNKYNLLKKIYLDINKTYITEEKLENLLNAIGYIKNKMLTADQYLQDNKIDIDNFKIIYNSYENYKKKYNLLDFDDMLTISLEILKNSKILLEKYRNRYKFIQVDEGQDTSKIQMEIIRLLALPENNLIIVADDDQSIYGFRGAYPKALLDFNKDYINGKIFFMEENYRSSKNIVSVSNKFIKSNTLRYKKEIKTHNPYLEPVNIIKVKSITDQYEYLIEDLKNKDLSKSCILYRNNLSSIGIIEFLIRNNISFYTRDKKLRFFNHWLIKDIVDFLILAKDTSNMDIYENIYYKIKGYISKNQINYAKTLDANKCVFERIGEYPGINEFYKRNLRELKLDFKKISNMKPREAIFYIEYHLEYDIYLKENSIKFGYTYDNLSTMLYYLKLIGENCENLEEFTQRLNHIQFLCSNSTKNTNTITLSTIHSSKGLEFENIYMIDLIDGEFPNTSSIEDFDLGNIENLEEERRLFYVGITRAKKHLTLIAPNNINGNEFLPSRFLNELEKNF
ncbi:ATP-dependent helicase [Wansuia hejianensis]|uniref:DNA 3'-5' helicase n=1 Tax=Wansuia hejianensis TaxID=2763667 RepID=A0A926F3W3_9FIRM|nr:ATP-dependent helicase [Wansuia hejianensis]MBC8591487.1 ATP-dependent helicase [Wansuia hejianensis]